jgi:hypothetical protein
MSAPTPKPATLLERVRSHYDAWRDCAEKYYLERHSARNQEYGRLLNDIMAALQTNANSEVARLVSENAYLQTRVTDLELVNVDLRERLMKLCTRVDELKAPAIEAMTNPPRAVKAEAQLKACLRLLKASPMFSPLLCTTADDQRIAREAMQELDAPRTDAMIFDAVARWARKTVQYRPERYPATSLKVSPADFAALRRYASSRPDTPVSELRMYGVLILPSSTVADIEL